MQRVSLLPRLSIPLFILLVAACGGSVASPGGGSSAGSSGSSGATSSSGGAGSGSKGNTGSGNGGAQCDGLPECDPGDHKVASSSECPQDDVKCYSRETCGVTIWCWGTGDQCAAVPSCPTGTEETKTCPAGTKCTDVTVCGQTIHCAPICEGPPPVCNAGDRQVKSPNDCPQDASCYSRTTCNYTIWCTDAK